MTKGMTKSMSKTALDYIPKSRFAEKHLIQVKIPVDLAQDVSKYIRDKKLDWTCVVTACLENFRDTVVKKK